MIEQDSKNEYLADAELSSGGPPVTVESAAIDRAWQALVEQSGGPTWQGATDAAVAMFEAATGSPLPDFLAHLLRLSNGTPSSYKSENGKGVFGSRSLMSVAEIIAAWEEWLQIFEEWPLDHLQRGYSSDDGKTLPIYTCPEWIPILEEQTGNFVAIDLLPGSAGRAGQIIYFGADEFHIRCIADDLVDLLERERALIASGPPDDEDWIVA